MSKTILLLSFSCVLCLFSCTETPKKEARETVKTETKPADSPQIVGGDLDEHGCKGSAGYSWSVVRNECIRLFESAIRLEPKAVNMDKALSAFIIFKSEEDDAQAELCLPNEKNAILLAKDKKVGSGKWQNATYILTQWKGMYTLEDNKEKVLYQGMIK
jgi:hypothetical protein